MSRFYGSMQGSRGEATRCGTVSSGIRTHVRGWDIGAVVIVAQCDKCGEDYVKVALTGGSNDTALSKGEQAIGFKYCRKCDG